MKICSSLLVALCLLTLPLGRPVKAVNTPSGLDPSLYGETTYAKQIDRIVFSKVQRQQILNISDQKYAQEFAYFFYKFGFKRPPVSYLLFENGNSNALNTEWQLNQPQTNLDSGVIFVLLVFDKEFNADLFRNSVTEFKTSTLKKAITTTQIDSINDLEMRPFVIENGNDMPIVSFKNAEDSTSIRNLLSDLDFTTKVLPEISVTNVVVPEKENPNALSKMQVTLTNKSNFDYFLTGKNFIQFRFEKDSALFANNKWLSQRIPLQYKDAPIKALETKTFDVDISMPVQPGPIKEKMLVELAGKTIDSKDITITVNDTGQKLLRIKPTELNYLNIRQDPSQSSKEVGRAGVGTVYEYTENQNNFHKIIFNNGQTGWVSSRYVEIIR
jgi:hypothetical protein